MISISPITSNVTRVYSFEVEIPAGVGGLKSLSKAMINQTRAVDKIRLLKKMGRLPPAIMEEVNRALRLHYDLE